MRLQSFDSKQQLMDAFCEQNGTDLKYANADCTGAKYRPHQYRGGWVIPRFGYETSRIGKVGNLTLDNSGDPFLACCWDLASDPVATLSNWNPQVKTISWGGENGVDHGSMWQGEKLLKEW